MSGYTELRRRSLEIKDNKITVTRLTFYTLNTFQEVRAISKVFLRLFSYLFVNSRTLLLIDGLTDILIDCVLEDKCETKVLLISSQGETMADVYLHCPALLLVDSFADLFVNGIALLFIDCVALKRIDNVISFGIIIDLKISADNQNNSNC